MDFTTWLLCNHCSRAFRSVDALVGHKTTVHPVQFHKSFPQKIRRSTRHLSHTTVSSEISEKENVGSSSLENPLASIDVDGPTETLFLKEKRVKKKKNSSGSTSSKASDNSVFSSSTSTLSSASSRSLSVESPKSVSLPEPNEEEEEEKEVNKSPTTNIATTTTTEEEKGEEKEEKDKNVTPEKTDDQKDSKPKTTLPKIVTLPKLSKESADAFKILFNSSMKLKEAQKEKEAQNAAKSTNSLKLRSSTRNRNSLNSSNQDKTQHPTTPTKKPTFPCPHCPRLLQSEGTLRLHMKLHKSIIINSDPKSNPEIPCKMCNKTLTTPPYKCVDCPGMKMIMDFPNTKIKREPVEIRPSSSNEDTVSEEPMNIDIEPSTSKEPVRSTKEKSEKRKSKSSRGHNTEPTTLLESVFNCGFCTESFTDPKLFRAHHETNHARTYNCKICGKDFNNRGNRNIHEKSHETGKKDPTTTTTAAVA